MGGERTRAGGGDAGRWGGRAGLIEIGILFLVAWAIVAGAGPHVGDGPLARQGVAWVANIVLLVGIGAGLRLRGQDWSHLGAAFRKPDLGTVARVAVRAVVVALLAVAAFVLGAIVMANIVGMPEAADTSGFNWLSGNLGGLMLALPAVWIASSFGEEVVYRGFLMTRLAEAAGASRAAWAGSLFVSAVVFGLIHYTWGVAGMVQTGFMGLALGGAWLRSGRNLWVTIGAHAIVDTVLLVQQYLA